MPPPKIPRDVAEAAVNHLQAVINEGFRVDGFPSAYQEASKRSGTDHQSLRRHVAAGARHYDLHLNELRKRPPEAVDQFSTYEKLHGVARVQVRLKPSEPGRVFRPEGEARRVFYFTDAHDCPDLPKDRFRWMGRYVAETKPDEIVCGGDIADFDAFSRHEPWHSLSGRERSPFQKELDSLDEALTQFAEPIGKVQGYDPKKTITLGNHEWRVWTYQNDHPELDGTVWTPLENIFARYGVAVYSYGDFHYIDGVAFVHAPKSIVGREIGGEFPERQIATRAAHPVVFGHTHRQAFVHAPKLGPGNRITVVNPGCAMPYGYVKRYARLSVNGWHWGVAELTIRAGHITSAHFIGMDELERRYA